MVSGVQRTEMNFERVPGAPSGSCEGTGGCGGFLHHGDLPLRGPLPHHGEAVWLEAALPTKRLLWGHGHRFLPLLWVPAEPAVHLASVSHTVVLPGIWRRKNQ